MNRRTFLKIIPTAAVLPLVSQYTSAQWIVYDPVNFSQTVLTAIRTLMSNINEATQITNQMTSLANEAKNLTNLPFSVMSSFTTQFTQFLSTISSINGLVKNLSTLETDFHKLFPDFNTLTSYNGSEMVTGINQWNKHLDGSIIDSMKTGSQILQSMPASQSDLNALLGQSQGAAGALQAMQAGNQIATKNVGELMQLNGQLATYQNAHLEYIKQLQAEEGASQRAKKDSKVEWTKPSTATPVPRPGN